MHGSGRILVVGARNVCRSPYIERLLAAGLRDLDVEVTSAGTGALVGRDMEAESARLLKDDGVSAEDFLARQLTADMLRDAELVLTPTRELRREVVRLEPRALRYTHAILDFSDLVAVADLGHPAFGESPEASLVGKLAARATTGRGVVAARFAADSEIVDPYRKRGRVYATMARQVGEAMPRLVRDAHEVAVSRGLSRA